MARRVQFTLAARLPRLPIIRVSTLVMALLVISVVPAWTADKAKGIANETHAKSEISRVDAAEETKPDPIERAQLEEIMGTRGSNSDRELRRFFEMVVMPLGICLVIVLLLRRGISG